jgi:hypothetical protein
MERDLEAQLLLLTGDDALADRMLADRLCVFRHAHPRRHAQLTTSTTLALRARLFVHFARSFF